MIVLISISRNLNPFSVPPPPPPPTLMFLSLCDKYNVYLLQKPIDPYKPGSSCLAHY